MRRRRRSKAKARPMRVIRLWTYGQADKALPYLRSITASLRQHWLDARSRKGELERMEKKLGPLGRDALVAKADAEEAHSRSEEAFSESLQELMSMDVF